MLLLSCLIPTQDQPGLYQCELCQWFVTESQRTRNFARVISDLFCRGTIRFFVRLWIIWKEMLIREAVLCDCYFPELPHLSFLFVLFDLCMNSNKTLAVCPHPCFLSLFCCLTLIRIEYFLQYMTVIFYNVLQTPLLSLAYHPSPTPTPPPLSGGPWAPHQGLPHWSSGIASSHNMAPLILPQSLERFSRSKRKRGVSVGQQTGTHQYTGSLFDWTCWFYTSNYLVISLKCTKELVDFSFKR